jgi:hypothetical protein
MADGFDLESDLTFAQEQAYRRKYGLTSKYR